MSWAPAVGRGAGTLTAGLVGTWPTASWSRGLRRCGVHLPSPSNPHDTHLQHHLTGPRLVPKLYTPPSLSGPSSVHQLLLRPESIRPTLGPQCFLLHKTVDSVILCEGPEGRNRLWNWLFTPQMRGVARPQGCLRFCTTPEASSACVCCIRVCASECELFEKHAFWHKTCDITHFILFEALL